MIDKFRAWDKKRNEWYNKSSDIGLTYYGFSIFGECTLLSTPPMDDLINLEITQFTGLKDKNGTEIYEGDIVRLGKEESPTCEGEVYSVASGAWCCCGRPIISPLKEVIGNIYENPDLIN